MSRTATQSKRRTATQVRPQPGPQTAFLSSSADIVFYGGAAGGGKTWGLCIEPLRHVENPEFTGVVFRRTSPQIKNPGGLWDESHKIYPQLGGKSYVKELLWRFPSGAQIKLAHLEHEKNVYDWQGSQLAFIAFDELTHFTRAQFFYLLSRNRSTSGVRPYVRATTNPDADSWVRELVEWWLGDDGLPIPDRSGVVRWFVQVDEQLVWFDSPAAALERFPAIPPKSFTFIPASLDDNRVLQERDPAYRANLLALPFVERERLLGGNWNVRDGAGTIFHRDWFEVVDPVDVPASGIDCLGWDFAATAKEQTKRKDPDFTASCHMRFAAGRWYVLGVTADQIGPGRVEQRYEQRSRAIAERCRAAGIELRVRFEQEPGGAGKREAQRLVAMLAGLDVRGVRPLTDKISRAKGFAAQAEMGNVKLVRGPWNDSYISHLHNQPTRFDDLMDASSLAFNEFAQNIATVTLVDSPLA